jgi:hypothetical protein
MTTTARGVRWFRSVVQGQEQLWTAYYRAAGASGREARAAVGEPPLRWSGGRLRGSVLPGAD